MAYVTRVMFKLADGVALFVGELSIGACGFVCSYCKVYRSGRCGGCWAGTSGEARAEVERRRGSGMEVCPVLECTVSMGVDGCPLCPDFPCKMLYEKQFPYGKNFLDLIGFFLNW